MRLSRNEMLRKKPARITAELLEEINACDGEVREFRKMFPEGASVTIKNYMKARDKDLDLNWLIARLPGAIRRAFAKGQKKNDAGWGNKTYVLEDRLDHGDISSDNFAKQQKRIDAEFTRKDARVFVKLWNAWKPRKRRK